MDLEQLKLVLETVERMGGDAKEVAIAWAFAVHVIPALCWFFGVLIAIKFAVQGVLLAISNLTATRRIASHLGISVYGDWAESDTANVLRTIDRLKDSGG